MSDALNLAKAKAFSIMVKNMIGEEPSVSYDNTTGIVRVNFTEEQQRKMIAWLDSQVFKSFEPDSDAQLQIGFGQVLFPWAMRYVIPTAAIVFFAGYFTQGFKALTRGRQ